MQRYMNMNDGKKERFKIMVAYVFFIEFLVVSAPIFSAILPSTTLSVQQEQTQAVQSTDQPTDETAQVPVFTYPPIPTTIRDGKTVLPLCSSFPSEGGTAIVAKQMLAGAKSYIKSLQFFMDEASLRNKNFIIEHRGNNDSMGLLGLSTIKSNVALTPLLYGMVDVETFFSTESMIKRKELFLMFPQLGDTEIRALKLQNMIHFRPSEAQELRLLATYAIKMLHRNKVAVLYEASQWGDRQLAMLKTILKDFGVEALTIQSYPQGTVEIEQALDNITKVSPNTVFCFAQPRPAYTFVRNALNKGLYECMFLGTSALNAVQKILKTALGLDVVCTSVVPPEDSQLPLLTDYTKALESFLSFRAHSVFYLEAYINIELMLMCLERLQGPVTIEAMIASFETMKNLSVRGLPINFNDENRSLSSSLWINPGFGKTWIQLSEEAYAEH